MTFNSNTRFGLDHSRKCVKEEKNGSVGPLGLVLVSIYMAL